MTDRIVFETCPTCDGVLRTVHEPFDVRIGQRTVSVVVEHQKCEDCGEVLFSPEAADEAQRRASNTIRAAEGLLQPEEIRSLRERLGFTQAQFERLIGVGPKTVVRWERGTVFQNGATDTLLRVLAAVPEAVEQLIAMRRAQQLSTRVSRSADLRTAATSQTYHYNEREHLTRTTPPRPTVFRPRPSRPIASVVVRDAEISRAVFSESIG